MNEQAQIEAIKAELTARGYQVQQDADLALVLETEAPRQDLLLDLVGVRPIPATSPGRAAVLIIEIANRSRPSRPRARSLLRPPLEDDEAVERFTAISQAVADRDDIEFQIRFLDVSVDQAKAREVKLGKATSKAAIAASLLDDQAVLGALATWPKPIQPAVLARLWARWLRLIAYLHPGRARRELKTADLRTLHKELYDQQVLDLPPGAYRQIHREVLATAEGGDVSLDLLNRLVPALRQLFGWARAYYGLPVLTPEQRQEASLFTELAEAVEARAPANRQDELITTITLMRLWETTDRFAQLVLLFQMQLGEEAFVPPPLMRTLLARAAQISSSDGWNDILV
ncbi:hypothetical protein [Caulobacter sp. CCH5-E12]|uniref:hypothetical protein n=1 Tax=Caulobacter sp. CCH5-E12 TaxID=1768770 RepID=UPI0007850B74|nr:hypothetical protein [Caulobacter sp. CCH5-E12]